MNVTTTAVVVIEDELLATVVRQRRLLMMGHGKAVQLSILVSDHLSWQWRQCDCCVSMVVILRGFLVNGQILLLEKKRVDSDIGWLSGQIAVGSDFVGIRRNTGVFETRLFALGRTAVRS